MEERLWVSARYLARKNNMDYTVPCATVVRDFIRAGTRNMVRENRASEQDFEVADANLGRLVEAMVKAAPQMANTRPNVPGPVLIREAAFVKAKGLCPLWPFC